MSRQETSRAQGRRCGEALAVFEAVSAGYSRRRALDGLDLQVRQGQFVGVVGPSGAGKTTLLRVLLGLVPISAGRLTVCGEPVRDRAPTQVGYVPQLETIDWTFPVTVEQVVMMGLRRKRLWPWSSRAERWAVASLLERLGIAEYARAHIGDLSGGQQQRVFLARALVGDPALLVLDEPTSSVDVRTRHEILHLLRDLNAEGVTIVLTTHDLNSVAAHLPWVACLNQRIVAEGPPEEVLTETVLRATYHADMRVLQHEGHLLIVDASTLSAAPVRAGGLRASAS